MELTVYIPTLWRKQTKGQAKVTVEGGAIHQVVRSLESAFPDLKGEICRSDGQIWEHINVFVNGQEIRYLAGEETPLHDGDEVAFIPAVAGGSQEPVPGLWPGFIRSTYPPP